MPARLCVSNVCTGVSKVRRSVSKVRRRRFSNMRAMVCALGKLGDLAARELCAPWICAGATDSGLGDFSNYARHRYARSAPIMRFPVDRPDGNHYDTGLSKRRDAVPTPRTGRIGLRAARLCVL